MALTKKHVNDVCLLGSGHKQCAYLDDMVYNGNIVYVCKKLSPDRKIVDEELDEFFKKSKANGIDPTQLDSPLGDNCQGYIVLKTKQQGYDVP